MEPFFDLEASRKAGFPRLASKLSRQIYYQRNYGSVEEER
jgi:hypothetical protein